MSEQKRFPSKIAEKHPNSKFAKGSKAYDARQVKLRDIVARLAEHKNIGDLQSGGRP